jgi:hypothetical protein
MMVIICTIIYRLMDGICLPIRIIIIASIGAIFVLFSFSYTQTKLDPCFYNL